MKKRKSRQGSPKISFWSYFFIVASFGVVGVFFFNFFIFGSNTSSLSTSPVVLGSTNKRVAAIVVNGEQWDFKNKYLDHEFIGTDGQPNFYTLPIEVRYSDGSSRMVHLGFQYLK